MKHDRNRVRVNRKSTNFDDYEVQWLEEIRARTGLQDDSAILREAVKYFHQLVSQSTGQAA